jgi:hypothetical protein
MDMFVPTVTSKILQNQIFISEDLRVKESILIFMAERRKKDSKMTPKTLH